MPMQVVSSYLFEINLSIYTFPYNYTDYFVSHILYL